MKNNKHIIQYDIIIPTRPNMDNIHRLLTSINNQSHKPRNIYILIDKTITQDIYKYYMDSLTSRSPSVSIITNTNTNFEPWRWVSYVRNFGINIAKSEYILLLDDDTQLPNDFIEQVTTKYIYIQNQTEKDFVLFPTINYHDTDRIQTQWYSMMHYWMMRPEPIHSSNDFKTKIRKSLFWRIDKLHNIPYNYVTIKQCNQIYMCPSICLFGKSEIFKNNLYDERMTFVYEDLDMTARLSNKWISIYNLTDIYINHFESPRNKLQSSFLTPELAYNKSKNRIIFVQNNATLPEKLLFYNIWLPWQTLWFIIFVLLFGKRKIYSIWQIFSWIKEWLSE